MYSKHYSSWGSKLGIVGYLSGQGLQVVMYLSVFIPSNSVCGNSQVLGLEQGAGLPLSALQAWVTSFKRASEGSSIHNKASVAVT